MLRQPRGLKECRVNNTIFKTSEQIRMFSADILQVHVNIQAGRGEQTLCARLDIDGYVIIGTAIYANLYFSADLDLMINGGGVFRFMHEFYLNVS